MTKEEKLFHQIAGQLSNSRESKLFGAMCIKAKNGKSFAIFWKEEMIFKLNSEDQKKALQLKGSRQGTHLYAPDKPMRDWIVVPFIHSSKWKDFAEKSKEYVMEQNNN